MKKVLVVFAVVLFTGVFQSCTNDTASEDQLYDKISEDKDEEVDKD